MLNITRDTGELVAVLVRATVARRVLEIGTSAPPDGARSTFHLTRWWLSV
jgi:hypothetical protein